MKHVEDIINELFQLGPIKTWSLIVTVFGDLDGDNLSGKELGNLMKPLGVKPEATRVALHRLRKDGWIVSHKSGREVTYQLSEHGRNTTKAVYDEVYGQDLKYPEGWQFLITAGTIDELVNELPSIQIGRHLVLTPKSSPRDINTTMEIKIVQDEIPAWFRNRLVNEETLSLSKTLLSYIAGYKQIERQASDLQKTLIRLLILHHWRRMALRPTSWAHVSMLPNGSMALLHKSVTKFLQQTAATKLSH